MRLVMGICWGLGALLVLTGCESTVDAAKKITQQGNKAFQAKGLAVTTADRQIRIIATAVVHDNNGTAVVVTLRNTGRRPMVDAPIAINVASSSGQSVFRNNAPGLEEALSHVPLLLPGEVVSWVNDQVLPNGTPARVLARVGAGQSPRGSLPKLAISSVHLSFDDVSGWTASGEVRNTSRIDQVRLVLFATARHGKRIIAAGRAIIGRLPAGKSARFHAYFIGNPKGAQISISAPPSNAA